MTQGSDALLARMMTLHPKVIDLTLDRVERLLAALDHPETRLPPVIHIAGTNGKGSTLAMIRAGLEAAGGTVHAYTSPHLVRFHERIRLAGELISEDALNALLDQCLAANGPDPITYFEITTCAAFLGFSRVPADWCLLETGLGGRLDATNVLDRPRLTVITPVSLDHQQYLGDALGQIAAEKAGILKPGVPCIVARQPAEAMEAIEARAARIGAPLIVCGRDFDAWEEMGKLVFQDADGLLDLPMPALRGRHQIENAGMAVAALRHLGMAAEACETALTGADWPARMQPLIDTKLNALVPKAELWLDGGHNPSAGEALAATLAKMPQKETILVCGMLNTKDPLGYLKPLAAHVRNVIAVGIPDAPATLSAEETAAAATEAGMQANAAESVAAALAALNDVAPRARILICGSLYLAGAVLREA
ncbi:bifunctional folylpolyglutamate synthase/dihydrofolate synthase [Mangrovicoccus algicola]|uniref:Dihydrofolate synthase/folylpolyglutamate synthase n=1 Tax=Mangrovicoccus algicola TaxID=2771008 RepID=A0A8J6YTU2_9RHOB|nr:folylpolyglutamate synthase/dihydrofolate synthase family protein [Mangrovicoccus algicola]MBE3639138.1 bifunctional folylpolyglutamate synthase/dihydrofolate synthase [Mangrovicoccus algicola]